MPAADCTPHKQNPPVVHQGRDLQSPQRLDCDELTDVYLDQHSFHALVSCNPAMRRLFDVIEDVAASQVPVLLSGESGTGKQLFAQAIHDLSSRKSSSLITVNCGSMPEDLLELEIFGARKGGSYTAASENRPGRLEMCYGGSFFLNEVGDLPLSLQAKLLRVLENHEFQPLGARTPITTDVRFIAATHRNLERMVAEGSFRKDLYFRLNTVSITIPPLRERPEDIPLLLTMAVRRFNTIYNKQVRSFSPDVMSLLMQHSFPGNVRELLNLAEQSVILCRSSEITRDHLPTSLSKQLEKMSSPRQPVSRPTASQISSLLQRFGGKRGDVARELNVDRTTLWRWMKQLGVSYSPKQR